MERKYKLIHRQSIVKVDESLSVLGTMADKIVPVVKADEAEEEDLVDPQQELRVGIYSTAQTKS